MASSLGRPVRLSSVRLRLLPRPGFVLYDLTVDEDPGFGAEPLLQASSVTASIRLLSLWRGRLEINEVSVDEASVNLVRSPEGSWNLESLFRTAATKAGSANPGEKEAPPFPYIAATNSRVNFKNGVREAALFAGRHGSFVLAGETRSLADQVARPTCPHRCEPGPGRHRGCGVECKRAGCARSAPDANLPRSGLARRATRAAHAPCYGV